MRSSRALFATAIWILASGPAAIAARADPQIPPSGGALRLSIGQAAAASFQLRLLTPRGREPIFDSGVVAGRAGLVPLPPVAEGEETVFSELRVWDAAGSLISSQLARLEIPRGPAAAGISSHFFRLGEGLAAPGSTLQLDSSTEAQGDLAVAGALRTPELRNAAGAAFFGACLGGSALRSIAASGSVLCEDDDLQNHGAEQNLQLAGYRLSGDGDDEGIFVAPNGNVGFGAGSPLQAKMRIEDLVQGRFTFSFFDLPLLRLRSYDDDPPVLSLENPAGSYFLRVTADNQLQITNSSPLMTMNAIGQVGIATTDPAFYLHLGVNSAAKPGSATWTLASDERLKEVESRFDRGLEALAEIEPVRFRYRRDNPLALPSDRSYVGLLAQQVADGIPEAVSAGPQGFLHLQSDAILWTLLNAIRQLDSRQQDLAAALCTTRPGSTPCRNISSPTELRDQP